jgi:hypothetical protein
MNNYELTHFRPQWIYRMSFEEDVDVQAVSLDEIQRFGEIISSITGGKVDIYSESCGSRI